MSVYVKEYGYIKYNSMKRFTLSHHLTFVLHFYKKTFISTPIFGEKKDLWRVTYTVQITNGVQEEEKVFILRYTWVAGIMPKITSHHSPSWILDYFVYFTSPSLLLTLCSRRHGISKIL